jgi:hypothetical protein
MQCNSVSDTQKYSRISVIHLGEKDGATFSINSGYHEIILGIKFHVLKHLFRCFISVAVEYGIN